MNGTTTKEAFDSLEKRLERKPLKVEEHQRIAGKNLSKNLSEDLFINDYAAFMELFKNSLDEGADNIWITYDGETVSIEDDGPGSRKKGIDSFFKIAESTKTPGECTKEGRPISGNKGFGTLALRYLCLMYFMESWRGGEERIIKEKFSDKEDDTKNIESYVFKDNEKKHGMKITMSDLEAHKYGREFSVEALIKYLKKNMPVRCDYRAFVNGKEIKPTLIKNAIEYVFSVDTVDAGNVNGIVYVCKQSLDADERGVVVRVNGIPVGDRDHFKVGHNYGGNIGSRLLADVHADGLAGKVGFDRTRFETGDPRFVQVEDVIKDVLKSINRDHAAEKRVIDRQKTIDEFQEKIQRTLNKAKKLYAQWGIEELEFADEDKAGKIARIEDGRVYINQELIRLNKVGDVSFSGQLETAIAFAAMQLNFMQKYSKHISGKEKEKGKLLINELLKIEGELASNLKKIHAKQKPLTKIIGMKADKHTSLNTYRLYGPKEIQDKKDISHLIIRRLRNCGELNEAVIDGEIKEDKFFAQDIGDVLRKISNYTPVFEVMQGICDEKNREYSSAMEQGINQKLKNAEDSRKLPDYVLRSGKSDTPLYLVKKDSLKAFKELIESDAFNAIPKKKTFRVSIANLIGDDDIKEYPEPEKGTEIKIYNGKEKYELGEYILHKTFGPGYIIGEASNKCEVLFRNGDKKVLVMGKKE